MLIEVSKDEFYKVLESSKDCIVEIRKNGGLQEWIGSNGLVYARTIQKYSPDYPIKYLLSETELNKEDNHE